MYQCLPLRLTDEDVQRHCRRDTIIDEDTTATPVAIVRSEFLENMSTMCSKVITYSKVKQPDGKNRLRQN